MTYTLEFYSMISSIVLSVSGIIVTILCVLTPRIRKEKLINAWRELRDLYKDVEDFIKLEESLEETAKVSKQKARSNVNISERCQPKRVSSRIKELSSKLDQV